jgi:quercetin dioxygenase-like cupin family protein
LVAVAAGALGSRVSAETIVSDRTAVSTHGLTRTILEQSINPDGSSFNMILDIFPPGIVIPPHRHPTVGLNYVVSGEGESQYEGHPRIQFGPGDTFQDLAGTRHIQFRNLSATKPLIVVLTFQVPRGQPFFIAE